MIRGMRLLPVTDLGAAGDRLAFPLVEFAHLFRITFRSMLDDRSGLFVARACGRKAERVANIACWGYLMFRCTVPVKHRHRCFG